MIRCALPDNFTCAVLTPFDSSMSSSAISTAGSTTTPLPITGGDVRVEHAARDELQREDGAVDHDAVPGVVAALIAHHQLAFLREVVGEAALALVAPLGPDDHRARHVTLVPDTHARKRVSR